MPTVLMIAFHYPPGGGSSGVLRTLKFTKYLPLYGWRPVVLTVEEDVHDSKDPTLAKEIPEGVAVYRARAYDTKKHLSIGGHYIDLMATPDTHVTWVPFGVREGLKAIREQKVDLLYSTSPLGSAHLIGLLLKKLTGLPWMADFRDPWVEEMGISGHGGLRHRLERWMESRVLLRADGIVATTDALKQELIGQFRIGGLEKYHVVMNGYDEENFEGIELSGEPTGGAMEIIHAGLVNDTYRDPRPFLKALSELVGERVLTRDEIRMTFLGGGGYLLSKEFRNFLEENRIDAMVDVHGHIPYRECLERISRASLPLLLQGGEDTNTLIPAKAFEYLRIGKPVMVLTPDGSMTAELIRDFQAGVICDASNVSQIRGALNDCYGKHARKELSARIDRAKLLGYSRKVQSERMAGLMDSVLKMISRSEK